LTVRTQSEERTLSISSGTNQWVSREVIENKTYKEVARPEGFEPPTLCLEGAQYKTLSTASGIAYEGTPHSSRSSAGPTLD
jgi:hypothetical protein